MYPNRTLCGVLEEMRACYKTRNFAALLGLIEETQSMGNRMEAALHDQHDYNTYKDKLIKLKDDIKKLEDKKKKLKNA